MQVDEEERGYLLELLLTKLRFAVDPVTLDDQENGLQVLASAEPKTRWLQTHKLRTGNNILQCIVCSSRTTQAGSPGFGIRVLGLGFKNPEPYTSQVATC